MMTKSIPQKRQLIKERNKQLSLVNDLNPGFSCQGLIGEFIGLYLRCEVFAVKIQRYYQVDRGLIKSKSLQTNRLNDAFKHFKINFDEKDIKFLFQGGSGKRGCKSARQLRNGYLHNLSSNDKFEIEANADDFNRLMKKFLLLRLQSI